MKKSYLLFTCCLLGSALYAQSPSKRISTAERQDMPSYLRASAEATHGFTTPPPSPVRTIAEWEELHGLLISWAAYPGILTEIVRHARLECPVYIVTSNASSVANTLLAASVDTSNVVMVNSSLNSVWIRDFGPWSAYTNEVDTLLTIDWIYNRPRPKDDTVPSVIARLLNTPIYLTTTAPWNLVNTGGNFMTDGLGTGFASHLITEENPQHTEAEIDTIMDRFMGIKRYIKMHTLPYDEIHHIDMHMKLLDEETILFGEYPPGIADGPQIEANMMYVLDHYRSVYGTPYKIIRIPMPAQNGKYPSNGGDYFTYTNSSFINKTLIVPTYGIPSDTTALRIYRDALPGYNIVGINSTQSINALGALHCITKEVATRDPLLISQQAISNQSSAAGTYPTEAYIRHRSGIQSATLYYRIQSSGMFSALAMSPIPSRPGYWAASIPAQPAGSVIEYYIEAVSVSGRIQRRPMTAPAGFRQFSIYPATGVSQSLALKLQPVFPNPSSGITCIPVHSHLPQPVTLALYDLSGKKIQEIYNGELPAGESRYYADTESLSGGIYVIRLSSRQEQISMKLVVK
jgi:agmatine deiminase